MRNSQANGYMGRQREAEEERARALAITLDAGLLWPGLTSMLAVADETCKKEMISEECSTTTEGMYPYSYAASGPSPAPLVCGSSAGAIPRGAAPPPHIGTFGPSSGGFGGGRGNYGSP